MSTVGVNNDLRVLKVDRMWDSQYAIDWRDCFHCLPTVKWFYCECIQIPTIPTKTHSLSLSFCLSTSHSQCFSHSFILLLTHSLTRSLAHSLTHSLTHSATRSLIHLPTWHLVNPLATGCTSSVPQPVQPSPKKITPVVAPRQTVTDVTVIKEVSHEGKLFLPSTDYSRDLSARHVDGLKWYMTGNNFQRLRLTYRFVFCLVVTIWITGCVRVQ